MKYTQSSKYWKYQITFAFNLKNLIVILLKNCILFLSDLLIMKNSNVVLSCNREDMAPSPLIFMSEFRALRNERK